MRKYVYKKGAKREIGDQEIDETKDFRALKANYNRTLDRLHKRPLYKDPKMFLILVLVIVVTYVISMEPDPEPVKKSNNNPQDTIQVDG